MRLFRLVLAGLLCGSVVLGGCKKEQSPPAPGETVTNSVGMTFAYLPAGVFQMGSPSDEQYRQEEEVQHYVTISRPFWMQTTEVTQAQWKAVMGNNPSKFTGDDLPVEKVSRLDAKAFCAKLSEKEGRIYRLPTEAQWEYACRAGGLSSFAGTGELREMGWYSDNSGDQTHPVAQKAPNVWGLYDMHGNVSEWCADTYKTPYSPEDVTDPNVTGKGRYLVVRGGSYSQFAPAARCAARASSSPAYKVARTGFRVVMETEK